MATRYTVEALLSKREIDGNIEYLVRWAGNYMPTWEKAKLIEEDCPQLVAEFNKVSNAMRYTSRVLHVNLHSLYHVGTSTDSCVEAT